MCFCIQEQSRLMLLTFSLNYALWNLILHVKSCCIHCTTFWTFCVHFLWFVISYDGISTWDFRYFALNHALLIDEMCFSTKNRGEWSKDMFVLKLKPYQNLLHPLFYVLFTSPWKKNTPKTFLIPHLWCVRSFFSSKY